MKLSQLTGNRELQKLKRLSMERLIKAVLLENPHSHRQERLVYETTPDHLTIHMDKEATKIRANNLDQQQCPVRTTTQNKRILTQWMLIGHRNVDFLSNITTVRNWEI